jgi:RNA polymerase sigma-70 factor (sigma-E family)
MSNSPGNLARLCRVYRSSWRAGVTMADDDGSFEDFARARLPALLRFAHAVCGDPHTAADLVQDALERTGVHWSRIDRTGDAEAYVRRAIINGRTSRWRKLRRESLVDVVPDRPPYDDRAPHDDTVWQLLATLPRRQRAVLVLRYYEDMSEQQIATTLGCAPGTVKSQASKALAKLRAAYDADAQLREATTWT